METSVSQPVASACAARYSSLRTLLPPYCEPRVAVLALRPDLDLAAEVLAQSVEAVDRRRPEQQRHAIEGLDAHRPILCRASRQLSRTRGTTSRPRSSIERRMPSCGIPPIVNWQQEAVVAEELVLEEDLVDHFL
jgi:hypothetical protein